MNDTDILLKFKGDTKDADKKMDELSSKIASFSKNFGKVMVSGVTVATTAMIGLTTEAVNAYANIEQSIGGVETLFKDDADIVIENAKRAFETAGVSANDYMAGVTSFAASLLQSTAGNTKEAADIADTAFRDMSDNANKFGTDMSMIQSAYQGFAKQNYTMLDNLKLGYGGTKTEMERLLADATELSGVQYDISNLADVYNAIHVIQEELGVTGTTAKEASTTITGSMNMARAAFQNFISGATGVDDFVNSVIKAATNISNAVLELLPDLVSGLGKLIQGLIPAIPNIFKQLLPPILEAGIGLANSFITILPQILTVIASMMPDIITAIIDGLLTLLEDIDLLIDCGLQLAIGILQGVLKAIPIIIARAPELLLAMTTSLIQSLPMVFKFGVDLVKTMLTGIMSIIKSIPEAFKNAFSSAWNAVKQIFSTVASFFQSTFSRAWEAVKKVFSSGGKIFDGIKEGIFESFRTIVNGLIKGINKVVAIPFKAINKVLSKIKGISVAGIKPFKWISTFTVPQLPMLSVGTNYVPEDMLAMIHKGEAVVPKKFNPYASGINSSTFGSMQNGRQKPIINVYANFETDPIGQVVSKIKTYSGGAKNDYNYGYGG